MYDVIIKNGTIIDGTGKDGYKADIAIMNDKIAKIGVINEEAKKIIDASGKQITPGFIDPHSHSDLSLLAFPKNEAYTLQGVTTQICGNCGLSAGPIGEKYWEFLCWEYDCLNETCKSIFLPYTWQSDPTLMKKVMKEKHNLTIDWVSLKEFMDKAEKEKFSCNYYPISGHNHIRNAVMGKEYREATKEEIEQMKAILRDDMEHGSRGFSTGLDYLPGRYASYEEIYELAKVAKEYDGVYATHVRGFNYETGKDDGGLYGVQEATRICRELKIPTNLSHMHIVIEDESKSEKELALLSLKELERGYREENLPMMYDVISNADAGGSTIPYLINFLRPWVVMCGSIENFLDKIEYEDFLEMMQEQIDSGKAMMLSMPRIEDSINVVESNKILHNKTLKTLMLENNVDTPLAMILKLVKEDPYTTMTFVCEGGEEAVEILLNSEIAMPSSDGFAFDLDTTLDLPAPLNRMPHPNNYNYAIRYLTHYGPKRFEDKVYKMTKLVADFFKIENRGQLKEGYYADLVVLDKNNLRANADAISGGKAPDGIEYVFINGKLAARDKKHTGILAGKVLRRK